MLASEIAHLGGLGVDDTVGALDVRVNKFAVLNVDERAEECDGREDEGKAPDWCELDEEIGDEGGGEGSNSRKDILDEQDTLEFDNKEVDELFDVIESAFQSLFGDGVVTTRAE